MGKPPSKPRRLWILQLIALAQLAFALMRLTRGLAALRDQPFRLEGLWWLFGSLGALVCLTVLILATARRLPRAETVAPLVGLACWVQGIVGAVRSLTGPPPPDVAPYLFSGVSLTSEIVGLILVHGFMLWLVGSLLWHGRTRAFLRSEAE
jgi:hypothetical protein